MQQVITWFKSHWRSVCFTAGLVGCLILFAGGWGWSDNAETPFFQVLWIVFAILGLIGFIGGIHWFASSRKKFK